MGEKELWREFYCKGEKGNDIVFGGESRVDNFLMNSIFIFNENDSVEK